MTSKPALPLCLIGLCLLLSACDSIVFQHPLPFAKDDRLLGPWHNEKGELQIVVKRGKNGSYEIWDIDDKGKEKKDPTVAYIAQAGDKLFLEGPEKCPGAAGSAKDCWNIVHIVLREKELQLWTINESIFADRSVTGQIQGLAHTLSMKIDGTGKRSDVTITVTEAPPNLAAFLERYTGTPGALSGPHTVLRK